MQIRTSWLTETKELAPNGNTYTTNYSYDGFYRLDEIAYPNISIKHLYDANNNLTDIVNSTNPSAFLWAKWIENINGSSKLISYGNGFQTHYTYDNNLNLETVNSVNTNTNQVAMNIKYDFDVANQNLLGKQYLKYGNSEQFTYDNMDRLTNINVNVLGQTAINYPIQYATNGNITEKYDAGKYTYNATKVNALASNSYHSSLSPVIIPASMEQAQAFTYTQSNKVASLTQDVKTLEMKYGFNDQRTHTLIKENTNTTTEIFYIASANMEIVNGTEITYLYAQGQPFAVHKKSGESEIIDYLHLDYQGSIMAITNQSGTILEERNGVYAEPSRSNVLGIPITIGTRNPNTLEYILPNPFGSGSPVKRGFTFHEHLEEFNLINMNGRMYDPLLARFLNADPLLQDNTDGQNFNRYSYVLNNPTKYTDPSGYAYTGTGKGDDFVQSSSYKVRLFHMDGTYDTYIYLKDIIINDSRKKGPGFNFYEPHFYVPKAEFSYYINNSNYKSGMGATSNTWSTNMMTAYGALQNNTGKAWYENTTIENINNGNTAAGITTGFISSGYGFSASNVYKYAQQFGSRLVSAPALTKLNGINAISMANVLGRANIITGVIGATYSLGRYGTDKINGREGRAKDLADGLIGLGGTGVGVAATLGMISNPIGWGVGIGVGIYFGIRFVYDLNHP